MKTNKWRVVYGETRPAWEKSFPTKKEADAFAKEHRSFGDKVFSVAKIKPGEPPQSMQATIEAVRNPKALFIVSQKPKQPEHYYTIVMVVEADNEREAVRLAGLTPSNDYMKVKAVRLSPGAIHRF